MKYIRFAALIIALSATLPISVFAQEATPKVVNKAQSEVASKTAHFATIKASDPLLKGALKAKELVAAEKMVDKAGKFTGTIVKVFVTQNNSIVILNFDEKYREALTAILKPENYAKFPDMKTLSGKTVLVSGKFIAYKKQVEIELTEPSQIKIVQ